MSLRKKLIAGNWKMYKGSADVAAFIGALAGRVNEFRESQLVVFCQAPLLPVVQMEWQQAGLGSWLQWGPQNIYWEEKGAFTGELSPALARDFGSTYALAGHSERRQLFQETNTTAAKRALAAHAFGMKAVFCLGETLAEREAGRTFEVIHEQCQALFDLSPKGPDGFCFAYEPVWAIGTGKTATSAQAQEAHAYLRKEISTAWGSTFAGGCRLLYGGSVKPENSVELMAQPDVDGVLVGGASLDPASFLGIAAAGKE
jgi:triosephosphate isomerase